MAKVYGLLCTLCLFACEGKKPVLTKSPESGVAYEVFETNVRYAQNFAIHTTEKGKQLFVFNPHNRKDTLHSWLLSSKSIEEKHIRVPVKSIVTLASTHIGMLTKLHDQDKIAGLSMSERVYNTELIDRVKQGKVASVGDANMIDVEKVVTLSPDIITLSGFLQVSGKEEKLKDMGQTLVYTYEWMEKTPLARAEWMKFFAAFTGKERTADSIFTHIEQTYHNLKTLVKKTHGKNKVLAGAKFKDIWYAPGGQSYLAQFFEDAGGSYYWASDSTIGSIPLSIEVVLDKQLDDDIWIMPELVASKEDVRRQDAAYEAFKAFDTGSIYTYGGKLNSLGVNAWFEESIVNPDSVLMDMIKAINPECLPNYEFLYLKKIE